jgi:hypothetical protein
MQLIATHCVLPPAAAAQSVSLHCSLQVRSLRIRTSCTDLAVTLLLSCCTAPHTTTTTTTAPLHHVLPDMRYAATHADDC